MNKIDIAIEDFEDNLGFNISKVETTLDSGKSPDEIFSLSLCQKFYGKDDELKKVIDEANRILKIMLKENKNGYYRKKIEYFYSLISNMYYLSKDFKNAAGYSMKSLSYNKNDISYWLEFLFSLRAMGEFEIFETAMFNFNKLCSSWNKSPERNLTQEKFMNMVNQLDA